MNVVSGLIEEIYIEEGSTMAAVNVEGAFMRVPLYFLPHAHVGDEILIDSGVAVSNVRIKTFEEA